MHGLSGVIREDWIGREVKIIGAKNKSYLGIVGKVVDETKHFLLIKTPVKVLKMLKNSSIFELSWNNRKVIVKGKDIEVAPEERLKLKV
ncbi:ribonuclease P protein subunit [Candidatus Woesearchaeota archaeon]|nr:ribonuclease P protein subunit [Candidatus Woesearchaeota archaeon]MBW2978543.1 ribonuclease P protein subunit [Candidatus Woesearchaeota archaeon]